MKYQLKWYNLKCNFDNVEVSSNIIIDVAMEKR